MPKRRRARGEIAPPGRIDLAVLVPLLALLAAASLPVPASPAPIRLDCLAESAACPEIRIEGDPFQEIPGLGPSPFRGYGDPSIREAPSGGRLWMSYSYLAVHSEPSQPGVPPVHETTVSVHLASSDDGGETWEFRRRLWTSRAETDPAPPGGRGLSVHEVSTVAPRVEGEKVRWFGMHLRYFEPFGPEGRRAGSFHFRLARARKPVKLRNRPQARLGGPWTDPAWEPDLDLSTLDPEIGRCAVWTEPALFGLGGRLYLVAQCLVIDPATGARERRREFLGVFVSDGTGRIDRLDWRWVGKLTTRADARALKGHVLTQPEVTTSRDGSLLLLVTPKRLTPRELHKGCRALELESLDPPRLRRNAAGKPIVRADIRSSDSTGLGPGLCSYDPASSTGILFVRTEIDLTLPEVVFRLHATGVHP